MSSRGESISNLMKRIAEEGVRFIDLQFTDVPGRLQHVTIPVGRFSSSAFLEGVPKLDGSSIRGFMEIFESDLVLKPDPSTFAIIPWMSVENKTARFLCDVYVGYGKGRLSRDPRYVAQRAEEYALEQGFLSYWGPEIEFFVFKRVTWDVLNPYRGQSYTIESPEAAWSSGEGYTIRFKEGYFPVPPQDTLMEYRSTVSRMMEDYFGVACEAHHHEVATAGQGEIDMVRDKLVKMADNVMTLKYVVKNVAVQYGMVATMMPKPIFGDNASGMHVHTSLWGGNPSSAKLVEEGKLINLFYDAEDEYAELSQLGRYFVGGLLEHSRALTAITNPTTNSYRRLVPGYEAPVFIAWSKGNRSANVRIPVYEKGAGSAPKKRVEFRTPDPSCNPYLCFAAIMSAGLDGVKKKIDPGDPVDENIYHLTPERRRQLGIRELPGSLKEAIECLKSDREFLKPIFSDDLIDRIIENGLNDHVQVSARTHPYEFYLYFDI
ncbi:MAG: type I glutamate--ammonia ligase [Thermoproteota archaeon]